MLFTTLLLLVAAPSASAVDTGLVGGDYGGDMLIGFDPTSQTVSGYFQSYTGRKQFSCIFYLKGKLRGSRALVRTYFPDTPADVISGELVRATAEKFRLRLFREHGGCWNVQHFADKDQPSEFTLQTPHPWISVAVVKSGRAYLFASPISKNHRQAYLVRGDGVGVRATRNLRFQVDFVDGGKLISGWLRRADIYQTP